MHPLVAALLLAFGTATAQAQPACPALLQHTLPRLVVNTASQGVHLPMFAKTAVKGAGAHPFYAALEKALAAR